MNIFYLHSNPILAARAHCDKHVNKMAFEGAQMLSTACYMLLTGDTVHPVSHLMYASTHVNHPCNKWVRESYTNFLWLLSLVDALDTEHINRYGTATEHGVVANVTHDLILPFKDKVFPRNEITPHALAMPDEYKIPGDPVGSYRRYYKFAKAPIAKWERGVKAPTWWNEIV